MDYTHLPLWVVRIISQVFKALKAQGVYFFHVDDPVIEIDREEDPLFAIRLRNRVKICCNLPNGNTAKITIHHHHNRAPLVELEGITIKFNRYIRTIRLR